MNKTRWSNLSLASQLGNLGSELTRAAGRESLELRRQALTRAFELADLTLAAEHSLARRRELARLREVMGYGWLADRAGRAWLGQLANYCGWFAQLKKSSDTR